MLVSIYVHPCECITTLLGGGSIKRRQQGNEHACMQPLMPWMKPTVLLLPEMRYMKPEKISPDRTLADAFSNRHHQSASCKVSQRTL